MCIYQSKKEVNEQFGKNKKLFWKEVSKAKVGKVKNAG